MSEAGRMVLDREQKGVVEQVKRSAIVLEQMSEAGGWSSMESERGLSSR